MPLTRPLPAEALPVVEEIRRRVAKPDSLPRAFLGCCLFWPAADSSGETEACVIGLHPNSRNLCVEDREAAADLGFPLHQITALRKWCDDQRDPQALVDAVWGRDEELIGGELE